MFIAALPHKGAPTSTTMNEGIMGSEEHKLIGVKELAAKAGVSVSTINRVKRAGKLPHHKIGKRVVLTPEDVAEFIESCKVDNKENH